MKYALFLSALLLTGCAYAQSGGCDKGSTDKSCPTTATNQEATANKMEAGPQDLTPSHDVRISVIGQGVAPLNTSSPAQAYALAKRAAIADGYRLIAEKVKGVRVEGQDIVKNMMVQRSSIRTTVDAMVRNANVTETNFKDGLCEVEMEIIISYDQFTH